jgi:hypothetical protein
LLGAPPLDSAPHGPRVLVGEPIGMQRFDALQDFDGGQAVSSDSQATICSHKSLFLILFAAHHPNHHLSIVCQTTAERKSE